MSCFIKYRSHIFWKEYLLIITITCDVFEKRMLFSLSFLLALCMVNVVWYWVVIVSSCLFVWYSVVDLVVKNQDLFRSVEESQVFYKQGKCTSPSAYSVWSQTIHLIKFILGYICIIWWVTYSDRPNLFYRIPWSNLGIILYLHSYAIATT
jgi:hypothetical protein